MIKFNDPKNWLDKRIDGVKKAYVIPPEFKGNGIAVDIGANVGGFPIVNHKNFNQIYCFEPSEYGYNECLKNTSTYNNVKIYKYAISNTSDGYVKLKAYTTHNQSGNASTLDYHTWDEDNFEMVKTKTLDDIYQIINCNIIDYLKIDCEGGEYEILMNKDLSKIRYLAVEIHIQLEEKATELIKFLKTKFDVISEFNDGITMHKEMTLKNKLNI